MNSEEKYQRNDASIAQKVMSERVKVFSNRAVVAAITSPFGTLFLAWVQAPVAGWPRAAVWLCLINLIELLIIGIGYRFSLAQSRGEDALPWARWMTFAVLLVGLAWGSSVWFFWKEGQYLYYLINLSVLVGVAGIDAVIMSPFRMAITLVTAGIVILPMLHVALVPNEFGMQIAVGLVVLYGLVLQHSRVAEKQLTNGIENAVRTEVLVGELADRTAALEASQDELNRAQVVGNVGSWVYDVTRDKMKLSAEACRIFGLAEGSTICHDSYIGHVHPDDCESVESAWQNALKGGKPFDNEHRILAGQTVRWVHQRAKMERDASGTALYSVGTIQEITDRINAETELRRVSRRYEAFLRNASDGVHIIDQSGKLLEASDSFCQMLGYSRDELIGANVSMWDAQLTSEELTRAIEEQLARNGRSEFETTHRRKDGSTFDVEVTGHPLDLEDGTRVLFNAARDITARKRNEEALRSSEDKFAKAFRSSPMFVAISSVADGRFFDVNEAALKTTGYAREEIIGRTAGEIGLWKNQQDRQDAIDCLRNDGRVSNFETELRKKSGEIMIGEVWAEPIEIEGQASVIWVTNDITARKKAEADRTLLEGNLRESQKMEALGTLAGGVAHDFNNIVAAIIGNVELACQDVGFEHPALESLQEIRKASYRARELVQQILAFGRRQSQERKVISLAPVVGEAVRLLRATLPAGVGLKVKCSPDTPTVLADATQIEQVLLNLCNNAWQAVRGQARSGVIDIRLDPHIVDGTPYLGPERRVKGERIKLHTGRYACLTVRDNGLGMDEMTRSRIFEPFFTTKPVGEGTGLGLAVVHGIVHKHEGSISVQSAPGEGAIFRVYFPATQEAVAASPNLEIGNESEKLGPSPALQGEDKRILYVDDDESIVFLVTRLLQRRGYQISGFIDPGEAIEAVRAMPGAFDLVVTDFNMPGMSGLDLARTVKGIRADLPVAIASGYITDELRMEAPAAGVSELIYKPNTTDDLCEAVAKLARTAGKTSQPS